MFQWSSVGGGGWQSSCESLSVLSVNKLLGRLADTRISKPLALYNHMVRQVWESVVTLGLP